MPTFLYTDPVFLEHDTGPGHPERPERLRAVVGRLEKPAFWGLERLECPPARFEDLARVHKPFYIEAVLESVPEAGYFHFDADTVMSPASGQAALRAAGAACAAVDAVISSEARNAFCAVRPPGHHAEPSRAMGFCFFNNVAVAAYRARAVHQLERVAVVDFDVHHGNGTQAAFEEDPHMFYASSHQWPCYPGTGMEYEEGVGNIVNTPLRPGAGSGEFRAAYEERIFPALRAFSPELIMLSAGYDAHAADPLAHLRLTDEDFEWVTDNLIGIAESCCGGRIVSVLEGGYDPQVLATCVASHVRLLMGIHG